MKIFAAVLCASVLPLCAHAAPASPTDARAGAVIAQLRKASLSRPIGSISSIHISGTFDAVGVHGTVDEWDDAAGRRFAVHQNGGPLTGGNGWDGSSAWNVDYAGLVTIDGGMSGRLQAIDQAYLDNLTYLRPDYGGAAIHSLGKKTAEGKTYDVVAVTPPQGSELDLWIDPRTHLIGRLTSTIGIISTTTNFADYRTTDGVTYPFRSASKTSEGNEFSQTVLSLKLNEDVTSHLQVPTSKPNDFSVEGSSTTVPIQIVNNHIYTKVMVNGKGPYTFILDTGGDSILSPEVATALQTQTAGKAQIGGVGNTTEVAGFTHLDTLKIGSATVNNQYAIVLPITQGFGVAEGMHIDGLIGFQTVARFLTTIDYGNSTMTLQMPSASPASIGDATPIKFYFDHTIPRIPITIDGVATSGEVDTGSRAGLTLSAPFIAQHPAIAALAKTADGVGGFGVGGPSYAKLGRVNTLQIGTYNLSGAIADFTTQQKGAFADPFNPANLGGAIWRRFTVTFDYPHQQMLLAKNAAYDTPFAYDRSGLFLIDNKGAYTVIDARPGTPAANEHLAKGDVIVSVNGAPASTQSLPQLRALFQQPPGTVVHLHVRGPAGERDVSLTLADYV